MSYRHPVNRIYAVEWTGRDGCIFEERVTARSATDAEDKIEKRHARNPNFDPRSLLTELDD